MHSRHMRNTVPREYFHSDTVSTGSLTSVREKVQIILLFSASLMLHVARLMCKVSSVNTWPVLLPTAVPLQWDSYW